jgi:hypothetical protein
MVRLFQSYATEHSMMNKLTVFAQSHSSLSFASSIALFQL